MGMHQRGYISEIDLIIRCGLGYLNKNIKMMLACSLCPLSIIIFVSQCTGAVQVIPVSCIITQKELI